MANQGKLSLKFLLTISFLAICNSAISAANNPNLKTYFNQAQIRKILDYKDSFEKISNLNQFSGSYRKAIELKKILEPDLNKQFEKLQQTGKNPNEENFNWLTSFIPGLVPVMVAEGTMLNLSINYEAYLAKAQKTPEKSDDDFIKLMINSFGNIETYYPRWFNQTWDYGGCSYLGKGMHSKTLLSINNIVSKDKLFKKELDLVKDKVLSDILTWNTFCQTKEDVIKETKLIINTVQISSSEKINLEKRVRQFQKPGKNIQFNCNKATCTYG